MLQNSAKVTIKKTCFFFTVGIKSDWFFYLAWKSIGTRTKYV